MLVLLPVGGQLHRFQAAGGRVIELFVGTEHAKFEAGDELAAFVPASPKHQFLGAREIPAAGCIAPIVRGILPNHATPVAGILVLKPETGRAAMGLSAATIIKTDGFGVAHPAGRKIMVGGAALLAENHKRQFGGLARRHPGNLAITPAIAGGRKGNQGENTGNHGSIEERLHSAGLMLSITWPYGQRRCSQGLGAQRQCPVPQKFA